MSSKNISDTFTSMPDVKSAEKLLHEREVDQSLNALVQLLHSQSWTVLLQWMAEKYTDQSSAFRLG